MGAYERAQGLVNAQLAQLIAQIQGTYATQEKSGQRYIRKLSKSFIKNMRGLGAGIEGNYDAAGAQNAALTAAMQDYLGGQGNALQQDLGNQLKGIDAADYINRPAAVAQSLGATATAYGGAQSNRLIGEGMAEGNYAKALPGVAALYGIQAAKDFSRGIESDLASNIAQVQAQAPSLTNQLYSAFTSNKLQRQQNQLERDKFNYETSQAGLPAGIDPGDLANAVGVAQGVATQMIYQGGNPAAGVRPNAPSYEQARERLIGTFRSYFPNAPQGFLAQQADSVLATFGYSGTDLAQQAGDWLKHPFGGASVGTAPRDTASAQNAANGNGTDWFDRAAKYARWSPGLLGSMANAGNPNTLNATLGFLSPLSEQLYEHTPYGLGGLVSPPIFAAHKLFGLFR